MSVCQNPSESSRIRTEGVTKRSAQKTNNCRLSSNSRRHLPNHRRLSQSHIQRPSRSFHSLSTTRTDPFRHINDRTKIVESERPASAASCYKAGCGRQNPRSQATETGASIFLNPPRVQFTLGIYYKLGKCVIPRFIFWPNRIICRCWQRYSATVLRCQDQPRHIDRRLWYGRLIPEAQI